MMKYTMGTMMAALGADSAVKEFGNGNYGTSIVDLFGAVLATPKVGPKVGAWLYSRAPSLGQLASAAKSFVVGTIRDANQNLLKDVTLFDVGAAVKSIAAGLKAAGNEPVGGGG